ncbi:hypothetical protein K2173_015970 [Erythroxylum novogranatense]|uniref:Uncharacterized protein n=1 Tax=Erythroxylum novogranatense TaxID=1862640 RepID=A0AAV8SF58_9ROSI|nr:hypothetical protein K2173_015970 [Erythroxylum novogranatense]
MSTALDSDGGPMVPRGGAACVAMFQDEGVGLGEGECSTSSSATSSIGKNSDLSGGRLSDGEENEVQSAFTGTLDSMDSLEEALPIRRGISKFYNGKSRSFTCLSETTTYSSVKDIAKPENVYAKRRRNLLAYNNHLWEKEKNRSFPYRINPGGISKRSIVLSRSTLALAVAMSSSESISSTSEDSNSSSNSRSPPRLPPVHPRTKVSSSNLASSPSPRHKLSPWRSLSLADFAAV